jgi:cytochrome o ubiquinol oxidase subunit IV
MSHADGGVEDGDRAPGDKHEAEGELGGGSIQSYVIGLALSTLLTVASFGLPATGLVWGPGIPVALAVFAIAQMGVHLVFFLHITTAPDDTNNVLALAFGVLIVGLLIAGSLFIMTNLNTNMLPMDEMMRMQR